MTPDEAKKAFDSRRLMLYDEEQGEVREDWMRDGRCGDTLSWPPGVMTWSSNMPLYAYPPLVEEMMAKVQEIEKSRREVSKKYAAVREQLTALTVGAVSLCPELKAEVAAAVALLKELGIEV